MLISHEYAPTMRQRNILTEIALSYAPYNTHEAFGEGFVAYQCGDYDCPHEGVAAQAWDRGLEAAMRYERATR